MSKKVNPYEKKNKKKLRITRKQWTTLLSLLGVAAILVGIVVISNSCKPDPHAGHDHSANGGEHYEGDGHDHGATQANNSGAKVKHQIYSNADKTYRLVFRDNAGKVVAEYDKIAKLPLEETIDKNQGIYELGWATGSGANDFVCVYYNEKTGQVSDKFVAPRGTDGVRIAYGSEDQTKIIVQDLFNKDAYYKEYTLANAVKKNGDIIVGGKLQVDNKTVVISYNSSESDATAHTTIKLYE